MKKILSYAIWIMLIVTAILGQEGLVAHYPFNGNANDQSGNGNDGTVYGATLTTDRFESLNNAYEFDGADDYIEMISAQSLESGESVSFSAP